MRMIFSKKLLMSILQYKFWISLVIDNSVILELMSKAILMAEVSPHSSSKIKHKCPVKSRKLLLGCPWLNITGNVVVLTIWSKWWSHNCWFKFLILDIYIPTNWFDSMSCLYNSIKYFLFRYLFVFSKKSLYS